MLLLLLFFINGIIITCSVMLFLALLSSLSVSYLDGPSVLNTCLALSDKQSPASLSTQPLVLKPWQKY